MSLKKRDVLYCEGPGDIVAAYDAWRRGADFVAEASVTFSGQFFDYCRENGLTYLALSYCPRKDRMDDVENLPRWNIRLPKVAYELSVFLYAWRLLLRALRVRPQVIYITSGVTDWVYLWVLKLSGAQIVPILHNTLWPEGYPPRIFLRQRLYGLVWRRCVSLTLAVSTACARQVRWVAGAVPVIVFKPSFLAESFPSVQPKAWADKPFRVMFAGRVEENKGVLDILKMAARLPDVEFSICGEGPALTGLEGIKNVTAHGKLQRPQLIQQYLSAHLVVVPTRSTFQEGFAMVVAEAILLLRPVITSPVVPASEVLRGAIWTARTDDVDSYVDAIAKISADVRTYRKLQDAAKALRPLILDDSTSFGAALRAT
jgi:glycogen synthase